MADQRKLLHSFGSKVAICVGDKQRAYKPPQASLVSTNQTSDVVLETRVLVSRRLQDKNESLGLGLGLGS